MQVWDGGASLSEETFYADGASAARASEAEPGNKLCKSAVASSTFKVSLLPLYLMNSRCNKTISGARIRLRSRLGLTLNMTALPTTIGLLPLAEPKTSLTEVGE